MRKIEHVFVFQLTSCLYAGGDKNALRGKSVIAAEDNAFALSGQPIAI